MTYAAFEGIDTCPMEGFVNSEFDRVLGLAKHNLKSVVVLPIGFRSEEDKNAVKGNSNAGWYEYIVQ